MTKQRKKHCRPVAKSPVVAQTSLTLKFQFWTDVLLQLSSLHRSKPWGIIYPISRD